MSQTGTPTEFLKLGITEPDDTLNVLVDLNRQWEKIDTGVKNVDTKANTNASGISALNTAVQDNTENITNILETNVNQQTSIDTLQSKVATLEQDDTSYGSRITAVEAGVQENSELINDLEVDLSGVKTSVGTVPEGSNLQGEVSGLDTRVTALENSGSVAAVEARVTTLETEVGTVPAGETVQGQITTLNGQVNSGNIPFRFSVDGGGNYGYLKADDSFVPFRSGDSRWHKLNTSLYNYHSAEPYSASHIVPYRDWDTQGSANYSKWHDLKYDVDYTLPYTNYSDAIGNIIFQDTKPTLLANNGTLTPINGTVAGVWYDVSSGYTYYLTRKGYNFQYNVVKSDGSVVGTPVDFTIRGTPSSIIYFYKTGIYYKYAGTVYEVSLNAYSGTANESTTSDTGTIYPILKYSGSAGNGGSPSKTGIYHIASNSENFYELDANMVYTNQQWFFTKINSDYWYYI